MTERIIGIDFGTSTSVIRVRRYKDGKPIDPVPKAITFNNGASMVPTLIQKFTDERDTYFGFDAEVQRRQTTVYRNFKLDLENPDKEKREVAKELTSEYLAYLGKIYRHQSEANYLGENTDLEKTIISYPVKWKKETQEFMIRAAEKAGFPNVEGLDEAQASVRTVTQQYVGILSEKGYIKEGVPCNILLIDMGAGTTDLVLCRYTPGVNAKMDILNTWPRNGYALFGGSRIDSLLYGYIIGTFSDEPAVRRLPLSKFKAWKEMVVSPALMRNETVDYFEALDPIKDALDKELEFEPIDRMKFETILSDYLPVLPQLINETLNIEHTDEISGKDIDLVILTGGHSQWYFVREILCGNMKQYGEVALPKIAADPDRILSITRPQETVALGLVYLQEPALPEELIYVPAYEPDCTNGGNIEFWVRNSDKSCFRDAEGTELIAASDTRLKKLGHSYEWQEKGNKRIYICTRCGDICKELPIITNVQKPMEQELEGPTPDDEFQLGNSGEDYKIVKYLGNRSRVIIPAQIRGRKVVAIGAGAFSGRSNFLKNRSLVYVDVPDTVTIIEKNAFAFCKNLKQIKLHKNIRKIGGAAFFGSENLEFIDFGMDEKPLSKIVKLPPGLESLGPNAFNSSSSVTYKSYLRELTLSKKTKLVLFDRSNFNGCAVFYYEDQK